MSHSNTLGRNVKRDALIVYAAMRWQLEPLAIRKGWQQDQIERHGRWLRAQPESYISLVARRVAHMEGR